MKVFKTEKGRIQNGSTYTEAYGRDGKSTLFAIIMNRYTTFEEKKKHERIAHTSA